MNNKKSTKRALLSSVLSLVLCMAMLIGTTFAWFTDSVTSTGNIIKSGTLDVTMEWKDATATGKQLTYKDASEGPIFNYDLWEPGYVEAKNIKIGNAGTLALKYQLTIAATGEVSKLADVIDVYYAESEIQLASREMSELTKVGTLSDILSGMPTNMSGDLLATKSDTVTIALKMQETAGNDYQGLSIGSEFAVVLMATQLTSEADSFNNQYDALAEYMNKNSDGSWEINSLGNLIYFAQQVNAGNSYKGETVVLTKDIDLEGINWEPIGNWDNVFEGTFDGQGYTISNLYINAPAGEGVGLFGVTQNAIIKGINIENVDVTGYSMVSALVGASYPSTISDCNVTGDVNLVAEWAYVGGIAGYCYYGTQVDNCSVVADGMGSIVSKTRNAVGGITAWLLEGNHKVLNCEVKNLDLTGWTNIGGITGFVHYSNTIDGCSVENVNITKTRVDGHPGVGIAAGGWSYNASKAITITNNTFKNITLNGTAIYKESANYLYGSEYDGGDNSNFVISGNTEDGIVNNIVYAGAVTKVATVSELQSALDNATDDVIISLTADLTGNATVTQKDGVNVVINGNGYKFNGIMTTFGKGRQSGAETLTIRNINFVAANGADSCIVSPDRAKNNMYSYAHNVTVENCAFTDEDGTVNCAAIRHEDGGDKNWVVKDCTVDNTMHSLLQVNNVAGKLTVDGCTVNSKNGINLNSCTNVDIIACDIDVKGYAVRYGVNSGGNLDEAKSFLIKDSTLKSANDDDDAVIIFRADAVKAVLTLENTTLVGEPKISGATADTTINGQI